MTSINWKQEVEKRQSDLIKDAQELLRIKSVLDEDNTSPEAPLGEGVKEALDFMLQLGEKDGFTPKNVGNLAGHLEFGQGDEIVGVLCHVDVVPEGDGWTSDPYGAEIRDGKIFARGAIDDKGPTMAAYYAMKIVKELGLPLNKRVRMIIGTDEESEWRCVDHYFEHEEMPAMGFAPDADFPIIYAEKGIADYDLVSKEAGIEKEDFDAEVIEFSSGRRYNMVPDFAKVVLVVQQGQTDVVQRFDEFKRNNELDGKAIVESGKLILELEGVSAHGMEPDNGKNAGLYMAGFLSELNLDGNSEKFFQFVAKYLGKDSRGRELGVAYADDITGDLTINVGKLSYSRENGGRAGLNMRYPVTTNLEKTKEILNGVLEAEGISIENFSNSKPHHVDESDFLVQTLKKVYEEQVGEKAELISIGGGTYARSLKSGVAFGPLFPGRPDIAHQKDEYMIIEDLLRATAIYAQAIYELAK
ncbi:dipeptidase PepV [Mesobacillus selenatarsenatis]|uniref:Acetylornithine deacetylase/succinyl-diaminopimelate desuccinylase and related deacylases n=1 Tax=Mesobacillus selenatarsenatis (strain DSM 18680 / JCM 14380 / FERM P-15431 / SF-1) TaxID=1321606 RepID=A0A0A8WYJ9_MESS1|nr:dipeptidase PepV [Mesobacillus selenatarsenatis]GAM12785.1 acetylornithine deacetylase/succinyl-diaminopimelate desuccinylase and related deacylases [Mesobacillus selenatarsenatis SF-1]